jgi:hypothetical protein
MITRVAASDSDLFPSTGKPVLSPSAKLRINSAEGIEMGVLNKT